MCKPFMPFVLAESEGEEEDDIGTPAIAVVLADLPRDRVLPCPLEVTLAYDTIEMLDTLVLELSTVEARPEAILRGRCR